MANFFLKPTSSSQSASTDQFLWNTKTDVITGAGSVDTVVAEDSYNLIAAGPSGGYGTNMELQYSVDGSATYYDIKFKWQPNDGWFDNDWTDSLFGIYISDEVPVYNSSTWYYNVPMNMTEIVWKRTSGQSVAVRAAKNTGGRTTTYYDGFTSDAVTGVSLITIRHYTDGKIEIYEGNTLVLDSTIDPGSQYNYYATSGYVVFHFHDYTTGPNSVSLTDIDLVEQVQTAPTSLITNLFTKASSTGGTSDPYWDNVSLLLPFEGTSGDTTTSDLSTNNTAVTFYGTAQLSSAQAKVGNTSLLLDGNSDYIRADDALSGITTTTSFTIECWVYPVVISSSTYLIGLNDLSDGTNRLLLGHDTIYIDNAAGSYSRSLIAGVWQHFAYTYNGSDGSHQVFIDGAPVFTATNVLNVDPQLCVLGIGAEFDAANGGAPGNYHNGYIDEFRITKGVVRYQSFSLDISVPTSAYTLTGDQYANSVVFLSNFDTATTGNDESSFNHTMVETGTPVITATSKFGAGAIDTVGSAYVSVVQQADEFTFGDGDYTIEFWFYRPTNTNTENIIGWGDGQFNLYANTGANDLRVRLGNSSVNEYIVSNGATAAVWHHVILQRKDGTYGLWVDGIFRGTTNPGITVPSGEIRIGGTLGSSNTFHGYIDSIRITKGVAREISSNYPLPTEAFPATGVSTASSLRNLLIKTIRPQASSDPFWTNVSLLLPFDGNNGETTTTDVSQFGHPITFTGDAQISTTQSKWGGSSVTFDTSGDWLQIPYDESLNLSTGDFTIETWVYLNEAFSTNEQALFTQLYPGSGALGIAIFYYNGELVFGHYNSSGGGWVRYTGSGFNPSINTWYHIAVTREGDVARLWVDGDQRGPDHDLTGVTLPFTTNDFYIGRRWDNNGDPWLSHYQDDFRITKGVARYSPVSSNNLITNTQQLDTWLAAGTTSAVVTPNTDTAPDGTITADTLLDDSTTGWRARKFAVQLVSGADMTFSIFIKKTVGATNRAGIQYYDTFSNNSFITIAIDTNTGTTVNARDIPGFVVAHGAVDYDSNYWRVYVTVNGNNYLTTFVEIYPALGDDVTAITNTATGSNVFWGAQFEQSSTMTDYVSNLQTPTAAHPTS